MGNLLCNDEHFKEEIKRDMFYELVLEELHLLQEDISYSNGQLKKELDEIKLILKERKHKTTNLQDSI